MPLYVGFQSHLFSQWVDQGSYLLTTDWAWIRNTRGLYLSYDQNDANEVSTDQNGMLRFVRNTDQATNTSFRIDDDSNNYYLHPNGGGTIYLNFQQDQSISYDHNRGYIWAGAAASLGTLGMYAKKLDLLSEGDITLTGHGASIHNQIHINDVGIGVNRYPTNYDFEIDGDVGISGAVYGLSDRRAKSNIESLSNVLSSVITLNPVSYTNLVETEEEPIRYGLIAQEVEKVFPNLVGEFGPGDDEGQLKAIKYLDLIPLLVQAIKEQNEVIVALQEEIRNK